MTNYVALLRGVNVGGHGKVPMAELRDLFTDLGFFDAQTYIQSGNVVFSSAVEPVGTSISEAISKRFDVNSEVVALSLEDLKIVVSRLPFDASVPTQIHIGFASRPISEDLASSIDPDRFMPERFVVDGATIYLDLPNGMGKARLPAQLDRRIQQPITFRNWATVTKLIELGSFSKEHNR